MRVIRMFGKLSHAMNDERQRWPLPWAFGILILPLGISVGFKFTPLPFMLSQAGVPVDRIATIASIVHLPAVLAFLWAPLVDVKMRRRSWLVFGAFGAGLFLLVAFPLIGASHLKMMTALILFAGVADSLVMASGGGLLVKVLSGPAQARASAWQNAGQLGGGALGGAAVLWLATRFPLFAVGLFIAVLIALPSFIALTIPEPPPMRSSWFRGRLIKIGRETRELIRSPRRRWSALLLISPIGTGAAQGLLPAIASHYGVGETGVMWANGAAGGLVLALGSLCGALVPGHWDRRLSYAGACATNGLAALVLLTANQSSVYLVGTVLYLITEGLGWARFTALLVEIVGAETGDASTFYSVLNAAAALPLLLMIQLDGFGFRLFGTHGLILADAAPNLIVFALVVLIFVTRGVKVGRASGPREREREPEATTEARLLSPSGQDPSPDRSPEG